MAKISGGVCTDGLSQLMTRSGIIGFLALALIALAVIFIWRGRSPRVGATGSASVTQVAQGAVSNSVEFVRTRLTGGVGVAIAIDSTTGLPTVGAVMADSPASRAGLRVGDRVTKIGGIATTGLALTQVVQRVRGFTGGTISLGVQRGGSNIDFVIERTSWNTLRGKSFTPKDSTPASLCSPP
jgi:membrane-associated protease RseP (regulator of RpoE activity)